MIFLFWWETEITIHSFIGCLVVSFSFYPKLETIPFFFLFFFVSSQFWQEKNVNHPSPTCISPSNFQLLTSYSDMASAMEPNEDEQQGASKGCSRGLQNLVDGVGNNVDGAGRSEHHKTPNDLRRSLEPELRTRESLPAIVAQEGAKRRRWTGTSDWNE